MALRPRIRRATLAGLCVVLLVAGCGGDGEDGADRTTTTSTVPATAASDGIPEEDDADGAPPEQFSGSLEDFYVVPDPLPEGEPGQLIRVMEVGEVDGAVTLRVMYHSRDAQDRDRAVTGLVTYPTGEAPEGGWPVTSWAHGTTGLAAPCAPSRVLTEAPSFGVEGVRVATDYIGLGPVGELHPYLSRASEGHSVIDAVRAARLLPDAGASETWLALGHSQGGHGAMSAHELGEEYAPELDLKGTVAYAPAAMFEEVYGGIDPIVASIVGIMGLYGATTEHPDIRAEDYVTPEAGAAAAAIEEGCLDEITNAFLGAGAPNLFATDPFTTEPAATVLRESDVGNVAVDAPLFLVSGTLDDRVVIDRVNDLFARLCETGQATELLIIEGANHGDIVPRTAEQTTAWLEARLADEPATDSCAVSRPDAPPGDD